MTGSFNKNENKTYATSKKRRTKKPRKGWIGDRDSDGKSSLDIIVDWLKDENNYFRCMYDLSTSRKYRSFDDLIRLLISMGHARRQFFGIQQQLKYLQIKYRLVISEFQDMATFDFDQDCKIISADKKGKRRKLSDLIIKRFKYFYILRPTFLKWELSHPELAVTKDQNSEPALTGDLVDKQPRGNTEDEKNDQNLSKKQPRVIAEKEDEDEEEEDEEEEYEDEEHEEEEHENSKSSFWNWAWNKQIKDDRENETNLSSIPSNLIEDEEEAEEEEKEEEEEKKVENDENENESENEIRIERNEEQQIDQSHTKNSNDVKSSLPSLNAQLNNNMDSNTNNKRKRDITKTRNNNHISDDSRKRRPKKKKKLSAINPVVQKIQMNTRKLELDEKRVALAERMVTLEEKKFKLKKKSLDLKEKGFLLVEEFNEQNMNKKSLFSGLFEWF